MKTWVRFLVLGALAAAVAGVLALKRANLATSPPPASPPKPGRTRPGAGTSIPRLVDLGAGKCIPCQLMAPILEALRKDYASHFEVQFIDVWENPEAGEEYRIEMIPTQIFYDASGKELYRHTGFFGKEDILAKWRELGVSTGTTTVGICPGGTPSRPDTRPRERVCYMCDADIAPAHLTKVKGTTEERFQVAPLLFHLLLQPRRRRPESRGGQSSGDRRRDRHADPGGGRHLSLRHGRPGAGHGPGICPGRVGESRPGQDPRSIDPLGSPANQGSGDSLRLLRPGGLSGGRVSGHDRRRHPYPGLLHSLRTWWWPPDCRRTSRSRLGMA